MASLLYFFAKRRPSDLIDPETGRFRRLPIEAAGLAETFRDIRSARDQCATPEIARGGPGGASGVLIIPLPANRERPPRTGYYPDFQNWERAGEDLWIGTDREFPPTPTDLLREGAAPARGEPQPLHAGYSLKLADGQYWTAPILRRPAELAAAFECERTPLPRDIGWDEEGRFRQTLKREYQQLWDDVAELCDLFYGSAEGGLEISIERGLQWAVRLLGLNYRFDRREHNLLRPIDAQNVWTILGAAVDLPLARRLREMEKKTNGPEAREASTMPPGSPDASPATAPAAESSG